MEKSLVVVSGIENARNGLIQALLAADCKLCQSILVGNENAGDGVEIDNIYFSYIRPSQREEWIETVLQGVAPIIVGTLFDEIPSALEFLIRHKLRYVLVGNINDESHAILLTALSAMTSKKQKNRRKNRDSFLD